jgi:methyl-accepting chemotaxis protein
MFRSFVGTNIRLLLSVFLLVLLVLSGYLLVHYVDLRNTLKHDLSTVAESTAGRLSRQLAAPLWSINEQQISSTVESEMSQHELAAVEIVDPQDGRVLFERKRDSVRAGFLFDEQDAIVAKTSIVTEAGELIGIAVVHVSPAFMHNSLISALSRRAVELLLLGAILVVAYLLLIQSHMVLPLKRAAQAIRSSSGNELDELIRANRNHELGVLLQAVDELRKRPGPVPGEPGQ